MQKVVAAALGVSRGGLSNTAIPSRARQGYSVAIIAHPTAFSIPAPGVVSGITSSVITGVISGDTTFYRPSPY